MDEDKVHAHPNTATLDVSRLAARVKGKSIDALPKLISPRLFMPRINLGCSSVQATLIRFRYPTLEVGTSFARKRTIYEADIKKMEYLKPVMRETPRLHPTGTLIVKEERQSTMKLIAFKPERFQGRGSSLDYRGSGKRTCPGITFATAAVELALSQLPYHFDWKFHNETKLEQLDMTESARRLLSLYFA
ncbi:hypothetical protein ACLB2K_077209 [Fragaria x ananassa]